MMVSALLHDIGYSEIPEKDKKKHWLKSVRKRHMIIGARLAKEILQKLNYREEKINRICEIIATHDNPYLNLPIISKEGKYLKEADIVSMTTEEDFWFNVKIQPSMTPEKWLKDLEYSLTKNRNLTKYIRTKYSRKRVLDFLRKMKKKIG